MKFKTNVFEWPIIGVLWNYQLNHNKYIRHLHADLRTTNLAVKDRWFKCYWQKKRIKHSCNHCVICIITFFLALKITKFPDAVCLSVIIGIQSHRNGFHLSHRLKDDMWNHCLHTLMDLIGKITCLDTVLGTTV